VRGGLGHGRVVGLARDLDDERASHAVKKQLAALLNG